MYCWLCLRMSNITTDCISGWRMRFHIISCDEQEVLADCGGFTGDTVESYVQQFGKYKRIYVYEPSQENAAIYRKNLSRYKHITIRQYGVGEKGTPLAIQGSGSSSSFMEQKAARALTASGLYPLTMASVKRLHFLRWMWKGLKFRLSWVQNGISGRIFPSLPSALTISSVICGKSRG